MEIKSTKILNNLTLDTIFQLDGKVKSIDIISAYTDTEFINEIIEYVLDNGNKTDKPHFAIYLDYHASGYSSNSEVRAELDETSKKIASHFDTESGVYLVTSGQLFHSKCIVSQSRSSINLVLGSINFTNYGFSQNEEIAICGQALQGGHSQINRLANQLWDYMGGVQSKSKKIGTGEFNIKPLSLRQVLLDGKIYYELKDNNPFHFTLNLPREVRDVSQEINSLLGAKINNSISVEHIILESKNLGELLDQKSDSKTFWKKYCIETCYGFWVPTDEQENIEKVCTEKFKARSPYYESLFKVIHDYKVDIRNQFSLVAKDIETYISQKGLKDEFGTVISWSYEDTLIAWDKWYNGLEDKIQLKEFRDRIIVGITSATVPNVWSDKINAIDFEKSFAESLHYYCIKGQVSSNRYAATKFFKKYPLNSIEFSKKSKSSELLDMIKSAIAEATKEY